MDTLHLAWTIGIGLFGFAVILNLGSWLYRLYLSLNKLSKYELLRKKDLYDVHYIATDNFSLWGIFTLVTISLIYLYLYASLYENQGMQPKPSLVIVIYSRWIVLAITVAISIFYINYQIDIWEYNKSFKIQGLYSIFYGVFAMIFIVFATLTIPTSSKIFSMVASMISAFVSVVLIFFPKNIFFDTQWISYKYIKYPDKLSIFKSIPQYTLTRMIFIIAYVLYYILNIITWFLSESNEICDILDLTGESITYLVFDVLLIYFFTIISLILSIKNKPKIVNGISKKKRG
jgi:hypothetical protein